MTRSLKNYYSHSLNLTLELKHSDGLIKSCDHFQPIAILKLMDDVKIFFTIFEEISKI